MTVLQEAKQSLLDLADLTGTIANGGNPDPHSVLGYQSKLVRYYALVGEEMARQFGAKERAYLSRKIAQAKEHIKGRRDLNMTSKDAEERAFQEVEQLHADEIDRMESFELYRVFLKSLQNGLDHTRSIIAYLKRAEADSSSDP